MSYLHGHKHSEVENGLSDIETKEIILKMLIAYKVSCALQSMYFKRLFLNILDLSTLQDLGEAGFLEVRMVEEKVKESIWLLGFLESLSAG